MKLIGSYTSPYVRKISVILLEKNIAFELVNASPWSNDANVTAVNPLGKVPVLVNSRGESIFDSPIIAEYLELTYPEPPLLPADRLDALRVRQIEALADGVTDATMAIVRECVRGAGEQNENVLLNQRDKIRRGLDALERHAREGLRLNGPVLTLADIAVACTLGFINYRRVMPNWCVDRPVLVTLVERLFARTSFARTAPPVAATLYGAEML
ncbi:glutathione S-transferase [Acerihabitans arboris]|uniref:Glutathione S-transferase n=1 Tax=Acerihabitans arboris TaxID=2691583 RepID=A0A845SL13_9GAMM|nr:glutathione S-transferase [Acerihabitans arboris]NDL64679.1 glutathione S-transferase [Acerihabitans arboris]